MKVRKVCIKRLNHNFECDWLVKLVDNNGGISQFVKNKSFLNQLQ